MRTNWKSRLLVILGMALVVGCGDDADNSNANNTKANNVQVDAGAGDAGDPDAGLNDDMGSPDASVLEATWDDGVADVFEVRCAGCHTWALDYDLVTVETVTLREMIVAGHGNLTDDEYDVVIEWIDSGTPRQ
jgi:hypothetical protein